MSVVGSTRNGVTQGTNVKLDPPEVRLSRLIHKEAGIDLDPRIIRLFLLCRWDQVSAIAHEIHEADKTK